MISVVSLEPKLSFKESRDGKDWLTSNEAVNHVIQHCPNICKAWGIKYQRKTRPVNKLLRRLYSLLYKMVDEEKVIRGETAYDSGGRWIRHFNKSDIDKLENSLYSKKSLEDLDSDWQKYTDAYREAKKLYEEAEQRLSKAKADMNTAYYKYHFKKGGSDLAIDKYETWWAGPFNL